MSTAVLDDRDQRRALARAQASAILDAPRLPRRFSGSTTGLRPSPRRRTHARPARTAAGPPRRRPMRRIVAAAVLLVQVVLLVLALTLPAFQVHRVAVTGVSVLDSADVLAAAKVPRQSIFTVDAGTIQSRVLALPWVASATVTTELPATVRIAVVERPPVLRVRRDGVDSLLAANGATTPATAALESASPSMPVLIDDRAGSTQTVTPALIQDLAALAPQFPAIFGGSIAAYQWGVDDVFSIWSSSGWKAVLGHLDTADAMAALPAQLQALAALRTTLDLSKPTFGYVDLENPAAPAVGGTPGLPPEVQAAAEPPAAAAGPPAAAGVPLPTPRPSPSASPSAAPSARATPTAAPSPTPATFTIH